MNYDNKVQEAQTIKDMAQIDSSKMASGESGVIKAGVVPKKKFKFDNHSQRISQRSAARQTSKSSKGNVMAVTVIILLILAIGGVLSQGRESGQDNGCKHKAAQCDSFHGF